MNDTMRGRAKIERIRRRESLSHLVGHVEGLDIIDGQVVVKDKLSAPIDEYGIPRTEIMLKGLFGRMATKAYVWTGAFDTHHMATPKADYNVAYGGIGAQFRGLPALKIKKPRQMHRLAHELFEITRPTTELVMREAISENENLKTLYGITGKQVDDPDRTLRAVHDALSEMQEPRVNIMPSLDVLAGMGLGDLRLTIASLVSVRHYNSKKLVHPALQSQSVPRQEAA